MYAFQSDGELMGEAPLSYLTRPYIVYHGRDESRLGSHPPHRGGDRVG